MANRRENSCAPLRIAGKIRASSIYFVLCTVLRSVVFFSEAKIIEGDFDFYSTFHPFFMDVTKIDISLRQISSTEKFYHQDTI